MQIRPIKTKADHREALKPIEKLSGRRSAGSMRTVTAPQPLSPFGLDAVPCCRDWRRRTPGSVTSRPTGMRPARPFGRLPSLPFARGTDSQAARRGADERCCADQTIIHLRRNRFF